jgi:CHASE1-domain containing sensor protein
MTASTLTRIHLVFLGVFLWAFSARSLARVWLVLAGGGALMTGAAWLVQRALL